MDVLRCVRRCCRCCLHVLHGWLPGVSFWGFNSWYTGAATMGRHRPNLSLREPVARNVDGWQLPGATPQGSTTTLTSRLRSHWVTPSRWVSTLEPGHFSPVQNFCTGQALPWALHQPPAVFLWVFLQSGSSYSIFLHSLSLSLNLCQNFLGVWGCPHLLLFPLPFILCRCFPQLISYTFNSILVLLLAVTKLTRRANSSTLVSVFGPVTPVSDHTDCSSLEVDILGF